MGKHKLAPLLVSMQFCSFHTHAASIHITKAKYLWNKTPSSVRRWKQRQATKKEFENTAGHAGTALGKATAEAETRFPTETEYNKKTTTLLVRSGTRKTWDHSGIGWVV